MPPDPTTLTYRDGTTWVVPAGWHADTLRPTRCKACGAPILFLCSDARHAKGPFTADGVSHFANCPNAADFRRRRDGVARRG